MPIRNKILNHKLNPRILKNLGLQTKDSKKLVA